MKYITDSDQELLSESYSDIQIDSLLKEASDAHPDKSEDEIISMLVSEGYLEEGLATRLKARLSQGIGAVKGLGQQVVGKAQQIRGRMEGGARERLGNLASTAVGGIERGISAFAPTDASGNPIAGGPSRASKWARGIQQAGQERAAAAQKAGQQRIDQGRMQGQLNKYQSAINSIVKDVGNDLTKLNMPVNNQEAFKKELFNLLSRHLGLEQDRSASGTFTGNRKLTSPSGAESTITRNY